MAKIAIFLKLPGNDFSVSGSACEIDHDQVGPKPTRGVNSEGGIVFFADGILPGAFESLADRASDACLVIEQKNFFEDFHELVSYFRASGMPVEALRQDRIFYPLKTQIFTEQLQPALLTLWCTWRVSCTRCSAKRLPSAISSLQVLIPRQLIKGNSTPY